MNKTIKKIFILILLVILLLALIELLLNLFSSGTSVIFKPYSFRIDDQLGFTMNHHLDYATLYHEQQEIPMRVSTDEYGFRTKESLPRNGFKTDLVILGVGDSMMFGVGVNGNETFLYLLEKELHKQNISAEVINAGVPGYGPAQEMSLAKKYLPVFKPKMVILSYYIGNDLRDDYFFENKRWELSDGYLSSVNDNQTGMGGELLKHFKTSQTYKLINGVIKSNRLALEIFKFLRKDNVSHDHQYSLNYGPKINEKWEFTASNIKGFHTYLQEQNISFMMMVIPEKVQFDAQAQEKTLLLNNKVKEDMDFLKVNKFLKVLAEEEGMIMLDTTNFIGRNYSRYYFTSDEHWNKEGHKIASELLADKVMNWRNKKANKGKEE